jgi:GH24 family phage-related lysozyme (muramidase)
MSTVSAIRQAPSVSPDDASSSSYTVQYGDTLSAIAQRFGISLNALEAANRQVGNPDLIYPGESLTIPSGGGTVQGTAPGHGEPASGLEISENGVKMIEGFEGFSASAYPDPGTGGAPWTIGYGHTGGVVPGETITQAQAETYLKHDLESAEDAVRQNVHVPLTQNQFDALVSLTYNVGPNGYPGLLATLNRGDYTGAQSMFRDYVYADGHVLQGLVNRRAQEAALFGSSAPSGSASGTPAPAPTPTPASATSGNQAGTYTVQAGDTLSAIAQRQGVSLAMLEAANPQLGNPNYIYPGETIYLSGGSDGGSYTVSSGDTLSGIAGHHNVSLAALEAANPQLGNPNLIYPGQVIHMP